MNVMNPQIPIEARQTVLDFVTAGTSFTAYEVTLEVRRRLGTSVDVPHGEVNGIVQLMFAGGEIIGYDRREDQTVPAATKPFRYYLRGGTVAAPFCEADGSRRFRVRVCPPRCVLPAIFGARCCVIML